MVLRGLILPLATLGAIAHARDVDGPGCPQTGPVLPPSVLDHTQLQARLSSRISADALAKLDGFNASYSSFSLHVNGGGKTLHSAHHTAVNHNTSGVKSVDGDSYYRIASITKMFTYLSTMLEGKMRPSDKIGKWIPELRPENGAKEWWGGVTLEQLGSHTAGLPRENYGMDYGGQEQGQLIDLGWPALDPPKVEDCEGKGVELELACMRRNTLKLAAKTDPANEPGSRPAYSNLGFTLLALALENATNKTYDDAVRDLIFKPLGMKDSTMQTPKVERGVISVNGSLGWDLELKVDAGAGAMYTTSNDMSRYLNGIAEKLGVSRFNSWLTPVSFLSSNYDSVGAPWEIFREDAHTPDHRPITMYCKGGTLPSFVSEVCFIPEYGLSFSLFVSTDMSNQIETLQDYVTGAIIEEADRIVRESAGKVYGGVYTGTSNNGKNSTIRVEIRQPTPSEGVVAAASVGLQITKLENDGKDLLAPVFTMIYQRPPKGKAGGRLYSNGGDGKEFRLVPILEDQKRGADRYNSKTMSCVGWFTGGYRYGGELIDVFRFKFGKEGEVEGLEIPSMKVVLKRSTHGAGNATAEYSSPEL